MKTKGRLGKLLFSTRLLVSLLIILGFLECLHWLQGVKETFHDGSAKDLILEDYPELSSMKSSSSNVPSSLSHLQEAASTSSDLIQAKSDAKKKPTHLHQNILLLAYARSGKPFRYFKIDKKIQPNLDLGFIDFQE